MGLEVGTYIADLVATNPLSSDQVGQGDDHLRLIKSVLRATFPNMGGRIGRYISGATGYTVLSTDNTALIHVPTAGGATLTHTVSLPALSSITSGFYFELSMPGPLDRAILVATGGASIEGSASHTLLPQTGARVYYDGSQWRVQKYPVATEGGYGYYFPSTVTVSGEAVFKTAVSMAASLQVGTAFGVTGASTFAGEASFSATVVMNGAMRVEGTSTLSGAVVMNSTLSVSGQAYFSTTMITQGAAQIGGAFSVGGATTLASTLSVSGATVLQSTLSVAGTATISGNATLKGTASIGGAAILGSTLSVSGAAVLKSTLNVEGAATISGAATLLGTLRVDSTASFSATVVMDGLLDLQNGQIKFPAAQNASTDANTLDDYEEGTFTPTITFDVAGDLSVAYTIQNGSYTRVGRLVSVHGVLQTSTFTHTTSTGNLRLGGLPFTVVGSNYSGALMATALTFGAGRTALILNPTNANDYATLLAYGSAVSSNTIDVTEHTAGDNVAIRYNAIYHA